MNGETDRVRKRKKSAIIAVDVRRFGHAINTDEVFGTHTRLLHARARALASRQKLHGSQVTGAPLKLASSRIPYATEQGISKRVSEKIFRGTGNRRLKTHANH